MRYITTFCGSIDSSMRGQLASLLTVVATGMAAPQVLEDESNTGWSSGRPHKRTPELAWPLAGPFAGSRGQSCGQPLEPFENDADSAPLKDDCIAATDQLGALFNARYGRQSRVSNTCVVVWHPSVDDGETFLGAFDVPALPQLKDVLIIDRARVTNALNELIMACSYVSDQDGQTYVSAYAHNDIAELGTLPYVGAVSAYKADLDPDA